MKKVAWVPVGVFAIIFLSLVVEHFRGKWGKGLPKALTSFAQLTPLAVFV